MPGISIVVPFYNEKTCVKKVVAEAVQVLSQCFGPSWEMIMVDDGSQDGTAGLVNALATEDPRLKAICLSRNAGQSAALCAGFRQAGHRIIGTMDGDGQNDPQDFIRLVREMERQQVDMMCGIRSQRNDSLVRRVSSRIANRVRDWLLKDDIADVGCAIRVFRRECSDTMVFFRNAHRFFPALAGMKGFKVAQMPVAHRPRVSGRSCYGNGISTRLWTGIVDLAGVYWLSRRIFNESLFSQGR